MARQRFEGTERGVARLLQGAARAGKRLQACMEMVLVMEWPVLMERRGGGAGDVAQLRDQRREPSLAIGADNAKTPHRTGQQRIALELNHRPPRVVEHTKHELTDAGRVLPQNACRTTRFQFLNAMQRQPHDVCEHAFAHRHLQKLGDPRGMPAAQM